MQNNKAAESGPGQFVPALEFRIDIPVVAAVRTQLNTHLLLFVAIDILIPLSANGIITAGRLLYRIPAIYHDAPPGLWYNSRKASITFDLIHVPRRLCMPVVSCIRNLLEILPLQRSESCVRRIRSENVLKCIENIIRSLRETASKRFGPRLDPTLTTVEGVIRELREDTDKRFLCATMAGMAANLLFAVFNGILGILRMVSWYGTLSAYYLLIFAAKSYLLANRYKASSHILTATGAFLMVIDLILGGTVALIATYKGGKQYPGLTLCVVAAYTFYKVAISVFNMHKATHKKKALQFGLRKIGHADALMSLLYLQTAVFFAVGDANSSFSRLFNAIIGGFVWLIVLAIALETLIRRDRFILSDEAQP